ncbi:MAG: radical SAM family heme chaperone HemW [Desulfarculaceae bacterium]|nr:radical SAM family heme chaperone HemW [Desulfarculaceae bacterium]MCF8074084.1 radical SAM family heme chaperone HemW [Desulfarculaceae bacterium]MCF8118116.1 radical SAM family heme chaperone HemW [Desulfarculaceae bacterium]
MARSGLGLYLHLPYCPARCPYCDFNAKRYDHGEARRLLAGLAVHLERIVPLAQGRPLDTVYFGGGTPAMLPATELAALLARMRGLMGFTPRAEISLEANPGALSRGKLAALRSAGFNRLSLGAQSFDPGLLKAIGRGHTPDDTRRAAAQARQVGFGDLNLDLIHGLPGQSPAQAAADIAAALELEPKHLSLYELTLAPGTPFGRQYRPGQPPLPGDDEMAAMEQHALAALEAAGLERYEVSNFARPGMECRHNQNTWAGGDYLSLGPGAHGHLSGVRWAWLSDPAEYCDAMERGEEPHAFREELSREQRALELIMLGLRTTHGVELAPLAALLGTDPRRMYGPAMAQLQARGWALVRQGRLIPTPAGLAMADAAAALFA